MTVPRRRGVTPDSSSYRAPLRGQVRSICPVKEANNDVARPTRTGRISESGEDGGPGALQRLLTCWLRVN